MSEPTKKTIGGYKDARRLDEPGEVYLARAADGKPRRLRLFAEPAEPERWETVRRETAICAQLDHPAIVRVTDWFEVDDKRALVCEYVKGMRLAALFESRGSKRRLESPGVWYLAHQLMGALAQAHSAVDEAGDPATVCHGHLSPAQILITRDGSIRLEGLGLAALTGTEGVCAVEPFVPPEQAQGGRPTPRGDIYSGAVVLWALLVGRAPEPDEMPLGIEDIKSIPEALTEAMQRALEPALASRRITAMELEQWFASQADEEAGKRALRMAALGVAVRSGRPPPRPVFAPPRPDKQSPRPPTVDSSSTAAKTDDEAVAASPKMPLPKLRSRLPTLEGVGPWDPLPTDQEQQDEQRSLSDVAGLDRTVSLEEAMGASAEVAPAPAPAPGPGAEGEVEEAAATATVDQPDASPPTPPTTGDAPPVEPAESPSDEGLAATVALDSDAAAEAAAVLDGDRAAAPATPADVPPSPDLGELQQTVALDDAAAAAAPSPQPALAGEAAPRPAPDGSPWAGPEGSGPAAPLAELRVQPPRKKRSWVTRVLLPILLGLATMAVVMAAGVWFTRSRLAVDEPAPSSTATSAPPTASATSSDVPSSSAKPSASADAATSSAATASASASASASATASAVVEDDGRDGKSLAPHMGLIRVSFDVPPDAQVYWKGKPVGAVGRKLEVPCGAAYIRVGKAPGPTWLSKGQSVRIKCRALTEVTGIPR